MIKNVKVSDDDYQHSISGGRGGIRYFAIFLTICPKFGHSRTHLSTRTGLDWNYSYFRTII